MSFNEKITPTFSKNRTNLQLQGFISTKPLWTGKNFDLQQFDIPIPTKSIEPLENIPDKLYLGKRVEYYLEALLNTSQRYTVIAKNLQIKVNKQTIGELDLLVKDLKSNKHIHIEQVYKFYIYDTNIEQPLERWIGPNRKDRLVDKLKKLKTHQLPLLYHSKTKETLKSLNCSVKDFEQQVCFKAHCFVPYWHRKLPIDTINKNCISGYYIKADTFKIYEGLGYKFAFPTKIDWPISPEHNKDWLSYNETKIQLDNQIFEKRAPLVWIKTFKGYERVFVVWW